MKVLTVISPVKFGGGERLLLDQTKIFKEKGLQQVIVCLNRSSELEKFLNQENISYLNLTNLEVKQTPTKREYLFLFIRLLPSIFNLRKIILKEKPEIIVSHGFPAVFLIPLSLIFLKNKPKFFMSIISKNLKRSF